MKTRLMILVLLAFCAASAAQKGTAPSGYYPLNYSGDTYTGTVVATEERQVTLEYTHKSKTETFTAVLGHPCFAPVKANPRTGKQMPLTAIPKGSVITVLYTTKKTKRPDGTKAEDHVLIGLVFIELNGEKLTNPPMIPCFTGSAPFKVF